MVCLNFKDLLFALGRENGTTFGNERAGVIHRAGEMTDFRLGERVCVLSATAFSTYTRIKAMNVARVPDNVSLAHAAAVPAQLVTAYYAINNLARLQKGETILIHSGAGGTGQGAIQAANLLSGKAFVTVSSEEKKRFLVEHYGIPEDNTFYSRNTSLLRVFSGKLISVESMSYLTHSLEIAC